MRGSQRLLCSMTGTEAEVETKMTKRKSKVTFWSAPKVDQ